MKHLLRFESHSDYEANVNRLDAPIVATCDNEHENHFIEEDKYLTFIAKEDGVKICLCSHIQYISTPAPVLPSVYLKYSSDFGDSWTQYEMPTTDGQIGEIIELNNGDVLKFKGNNPNGFGTKSYQHPNEPWDTWGTKAAWYNFNISGMVECNGDITSLLNEVGGDVALPNYTFMSFFMNCSGLTSAPSLPSTTLGNDCYSGMFARCKSLRTAPSLPSLSATQSCYAGMFRECTNLSVIPDVLLAESTRLGSYENMFFGCTYLSAAPKINATGLSGDYYGMGACEGMFDGCTNLRYTPSLDFIKCDSGGCRKMFNNTRITGIVINTVSANMQSFKYMFAGCSSLKRIECPNLISVRNETGSSSFSTFYCWTSGVSKTGTFVKNSLLTTLPSGPNGIPCGWTVTDYVA